MRLARDVLHRHRGHLALGIVLMLIARGTALALPATTKFVYDDVIARGRTELLLPIAAAIIAASIVIAVASYLLTIVLGVSAQHTIAELRIDMQRHVLHLPLAYHDRTLAGETAPRVMLDPEGVTNLVGTGIIHLAGAVLTSTLGFAVLLYLNWQLALATTVLLVLFGAVTLVTLRTLRPLLRERAAYFAELSGRLTERLAALRMIRAFGAEWREQHAFSAEMVRLRDMTTRALLTTSLLTSLTIVIAGGIGVAVMIVGARAVIDSTMTPGELIWFAATVAFVARPLHAIATASTQLMQSLAGFDRISELRDVPADTMHDESRAAVTTVTGDVVFDNVTFLYDDERGIHDIAFHAAPDSVTAIIGPSGAGKSTLISVLLGLHRPLRGRVLIDGRDLHELRLAEFREHVGVVMQEPVLFNGTIRDNIAYGRPLASDAEIRDAARIAHADEFIMALPLGYDTVAGERGVRLSAGQRQRIALARAIVRQPRILILDEVTAHLDRDTAQRVLDALLRFRRGRTTFVIGHDAASIQGADQVIELDRGRVAHVADSASVAHGARV